MSSKIWGCKERLPKMRRTIITCRVDDVEWINPYFMIGMAYDKDSSRDAFENRINRAKRRGTE